MASVLDQILEWSTSRPLWQRDALRRILTVGDVDQGTVDLYAAASLAGQTGGLQPLSADHIPTAGAAALPVRITGIRDTDNINALTAGEALTFAVSGLTIVYGDNGSGKSGYARVLKAVTRTRAPERVRNDIFREQSLIPTATIEYMVGESAASTAWQVNVPVPPELSRLSFFDRSCSEIYISHETDAVFRPFGLGLFDELVGVCERVRVRLDQRMDEVSRRTPELPVLDSSTEPGRFLQTLSPRTTNAAIDLATTMSDQQAERLHGLQRAQEEARRGNAAVESQRLKRLAERVERLQHSVTRIASTLSQETWTNLTTLRADAEAKTATANRARSAAMGGAQLEAVGDAAWRSLWEAARAYSAVAYPGRDFPVVADARCVLCQQPLATDAAARLHGFEQFVTDTTQQAAQIAARTLAAAHERVKTLVIRDQATVDSLGELSIASPELADQVTVYLERADQLKVRIVASGPLGDPPRFEPAPIDGLAEAVISLRREADTMVAATSEEAAALQAIELRELAARKALASAKPVLLAERERLRLVNAINVARTNASTNSITQKSTELTAKVLTEVLQDRFTRETDRLGLEHVVLRTVGGRRGVLFYRTGFVGAMQEAPLPEVLSEGEQSALGMAGFLAEVWTDPSKSGVIFDDPVSSLDHERRDKVAERLVSLSVERQTIVFTHDVAFVLALKKHAVQQEVHVVERSIEKVGSKAGYCLDHHRFSAKLVKVRLAELETSFAEIRTRRASMGNEEYRDTTEKWYKLLRRTWERAIEETLLGGILTRDNLQVHPKMVRTLVLFAAEDNRDLQYGYGRATELSEVHDESAVINSPPPSLEDMARDLEMFRGWFKRVSVRASMTEEKIYELVSRNVLE
jgi:hypothetical protein